jgi:prepilin-type N-terminal cleavage/methylation domain-containing protein
MRSRRAAFTLLEICLTLAIGAVLLLIAVPSVSGLLAEQRLHDSYTRFEQFVNEARARSLREQKPVLLAWKGDSIAMLSMERDAHREPVVIDRFPLEKEEVYHVSRPAALVEKPAPEWIFWPNGLCEAVVISYKGRAGSWEASFSPLTGRGTFLQSQTL